MPCARPLVETDYDAAAERSLRRYPGPVGELLYRELSAYARFGHRFATADALIQHLVAHLLAPDDVPPALPEPGGGAGDFRRPTPGPELWPSPLRTYRP